jgi:hypothetical protein
VNRKLLLICSIVLVIAWFIFAIGFLSTRVNSGMDIRQLQFEFEKLLYVATSFNLSGLFLFIALYRLRD